MEMFNCTVTESAIYSATKCMQSGRLSEGQRVADFERALQEQLGLSNPVCVNSGTSALHLALLLAHVGPGDEVIVPAQTFIATGMAVLYCGAKVVFADVDPITGLINPDHVATWLSCRTKAIVPVHWTGLPTDTDRLRAFGKTIVTDAAQSLGATYKGNVVGNVIQYDEYCCFSFQATKHLTTGDGGAVTMPETGSPAVWWNTYESARLLRWFDLSRGEPSVATSVGYKYHMNDLAASIGLGNLYGFKARLRRRQMIGDRYRAALRDVAGLTVPPLPTDRTHAYYAFTLSVENRDEFHRAMQERGVPCSTISRRIDRHPVFGGQRTDLPGVDYFDAHQINIPCHDGLSDTDVEQVIEAIKKGW